MNYIAVKTPGGLTERKSISNKIMQGDVLGPLVSSNMVDKYVGERAMETGQIYMYKNKVKIPPLVMQDDILIISECGFKSRKMNQFLNTQTKLMNLQFGSDKCEHMHIGKKINQDICSSHSVEAWKSVLVKSGNNKKELEDRFIGRVKMKTVKEKKYLGNIISDNGANLNNVKDVTNKATGIINKIMTALSERPYGRHMFKAAKLMREAMLVGGMLTNSEGWINITKKDIELLEKPDTKLLRKLLSNSGNPSKCFMHLELGIIPVKYVIMQKRMNFLHYLLKEDTESMISKVFYALEADSRRGDFIALTNIDRNELDILETNEEIKSFSKFTWKKYIRKKVKMCALKHLNEENQSKERTKSIEFNELTMSHYLAESKKTELSKIIFSVRSKTLDLKHWLPWLYENDTCIACDKYVETMDHFMSCAAYETQSFVDWKEINGDNTEQIMKIGKVVEKRHTERKKILAGRAAATDSTAPGLHG